MWLELTSKGILEVFQSIRVNLAVFSHDQERCDMHVCAAADVAVPAVGDSFATFGLFLFGEEGRASYL